MSSTLIAEPMPLPSASLWSWLVDGAASIRAALSGRRRMSAVEQVMFGAVERHASYILDAHDIADLHERVFRVALDPRFAAMSLEAAAVVDLAELPSASSAEATFRSTFGETRLARDCAKLLAARVQVISEHPELISEAAASDFSPEALSELLADFRTPPLFASVLVEALGCDVATLALVAPLMDARRWECPPWLRLALMERIRTGALAHLKLLAMEPRLTVSVDVLPLDERIDLDEFEREIHERSRYVLPSTVEVDPAYAERVLELLEGEDPTPSEGIRALFSA